jgi:alpha-tubulin suppressor-like RCC1 family protein
LSARRDALFVVMLGASALGLGGCKRHKPPARARVWLGPSHACALQKTSLELECWGDNGGGQLGDRTRVSRGLPAPVEVSAGLGAVGDVAVGAHHTCALSGGGVRCWGEGARGQLGTGLTSSLSAPSVPAIGGGVALAGVTAVAAGGDRTCVLVADGARCWGDGVADAQEPAGFRGAATAVAVGVGFACAAFAEPRAVRCSGADDRGQSAAKEPVLTGAKVTGISAGSKHACVVLEDGAVQCWGANDSGQLGDGTTTDSRVPALVQGLPPAAEVKAGANHTCARLRNKTVACWGDNRAHQLVNGTSKPSSKPVPVQGLMGVVELAVGGDSGCVRMGEGEVRCWGANASGQLGDGTTTAHDVPMPLKSARVATKN